MTSYKKVLVTGSILKFDAGVIVGLDTKLQTRFHDRIERIHGETAWNANGMAKREWKLTGPITLSRGDVIWIDEKSLPKNGDGIFEEVWTQNTYQEMAAPPVPKAQAAVPKIKTYEAQQSAR